MSKGYIFITSSGYDPERGKNLNDPYLGQTPTFGGCMPNLRRLVVEGDHIFVISGKMPGVTQFVIGGFEVAHKIDAMTAYHQFPNQRMHTDSGQVQGNVLINGAGRQHRLDEHAQDTFRARIQNYVVGRNPIALTESHEIARGREETLAVLREVLRRPGTSPIDVLGRWGRLNENQALT